MLEQKIELGDFCTSFFFFFWKCHLFAVIFCILSETVWIEFDFLLIYGWNQTERLLHNHIRFRSSNFVVQIKFDRCHCHLMESVYSVLLIQSIISVTYWSNRVCLDGERISERIALFELVVENSVRLVISREMWE
jgi:hypothetical protein